MSKAHRVSPELTLIELTQEELEINQINSHNLQHALEALHRDGIIALKNAINPTHLDALNTRMIPEAKHLYAQSSTHRNFGADTGNIQQEPVCEPEYIYPDILVNPFAVSIIECMLGPNPHLRFYSANTAFKATDRQPVHVDVNFDTMPSLPFAFAVNINLVDTSPSNGATEVWLGSHAQTNPSIFADTRAEGDNNLSVRDDLVSRRRKITPPIQSSLPKGSLIIRDLRLWHAGMPNMTDEPRVMLVSILFARWYRNLTRVVLPRSLMGRIDWRGVVPCVEWVEDGEEYLKGAHEHDLSLLP